MAARGFGVPWAWDGWIWHPVGVGPRGYGGPRIWRPVVNRYGLGWAIGLGVPMQHGFKIYCTALLLLYGPVRPLQLAPEPIPIQTIPTAYGAPHNALAMVIQTPMAWYGMV